MPRKRSPAVRTTVYRLFGIAELADGIQRKYLEHGNFLVTGTSVGDRDALLVSGAMVTDVVAWGASIEALTTETVAIGDMTAAAALLIRCDRESAWALTYGMGFQLLDHDRIDGGFGQRIAVRTADSRTLNSLTRTMLDYRARTDRFSIPAGDHLRGFGIGDFGELVTRIVGRAEIPAMVGGKAIRIRGADALSIPLGRNPDALLSDLDVLQHVLADAPAPGLEALEQLVAVKNNPALILTLESALATSLADLDNARLGLSWPHEFIDENGTPTSYRIFGEGRRESQPQDGTPTLDALVKPVGRYPPDERIGRLRHMRVQLFRDAEGTDAISTAIPGLRWLAFETEVERALYCLHNGRWYLMDQDYARRLQDRTHAIFNRGPGVALPDWPGGWDERAYNGRVAEVVGGTLLDRQLITTELHHRGIEICDVLGPDGTLMHIKSIETSAPASHLLAQMLVSADALLHDEEARTKFRDIAVRAGRPGIIVPDKPSRVVLGIARRGRPVASTDLFSFTKVTLVRHIAALEGRGVEVFVAPIVRPD
jgi:uncharacterized protein (TIGR04141 family)